MPARHVMFHLRRDVQRRTRLAWHTGYPCSDFLGNVNHPSTVSSSAGKPQSGIDGGGGGR